jgi:hypothetical protein
MSGGFMEGLAVLFSLAARITSRMNTTHLASFQTRAGEDQNFGIVTRYVLGMPGVFGEGLTLIRQWEQCLLPAKRVLFIFPPDDLLHHLLASYFGFLNKCFPLLHEPSFRKSIAKGQHFCDVDFAQLVLLVCAVASRYSGDPCVLLDGNNSPSSAGLKYVGQVTLFHPTSSHGANLQQLQAYCVMLSLICILCS